MENSIFVTADTVAADLGVSRSFAYKIVKKLNNELEAAGYITVSGRVSKKYYRERFYGFDEKSEGGTHGCI